MKIGSDKRISVAVHENRVWRRRCGELAHPVARVVCGGLLEAAAIPAVHAILRHVVVVLRGVPVAHAGVVLGHRLLLLRSLRRSKGTLHNSTPHNLHSCSLQAPLQGDKKGD